MAESSEERKIRIVVDAQQPNASLKEMAAGAAVLNSQLSKMAADDPGRAKLQDDFARLNQRIAETRAEMRTVIQTAEELAAEEARLAEQARQVAQAQQATVAAGQASSASMRQMKDAAAVLSQQLEQVAADDPGRAKLQDDFARLTQRISAAGAEMRTVIPTAEELAAEERKLAEEAERLSQQNQQVVLNGQRVNASFNEMKASAAQLEKQLHDLSADDPGRAAMLRDYQALQARLDGVKKELGETAEKGFTMKDALLFAGVDVGLEAAVDVVKEMGAEIAATVQEVGQLRASVNGLTGATGQELDQLTTGVMGLAKTFGKEYDEVLVASNALSKQMGISQKEALDLIEKGFVSGADANKDFLDQVKEYGPQFKAAGLSASQFIGQISQSVTTGVFSDKGADVIKEFGLRITEQTKSTSDAMEAAFGTEFTQKLFKGIKDGSITSAEALQQVAKQMDETKIPANQLQTVIADVFGGPGEDAGIEYIKSLKNVAKGVDELIDKNNPYIRQQQALLDSNRKLSEAQNDLAKEFEGTGSTMEILANEGGTFLYTLLASLAATFKELAAPIAEVWDELLQLGESMGLVSREGSLAKDIAEGLGAVIRLLFTPTRLLWGALSEVAKATIEWAKGSDTARSVLYLLVAPLRMLFDMIRDAPAFFDGFSAAAQASFGQVGRAWRRVLAGDFSGAADEFARIGRSAGEAYLQAFNTAHAAKAPAEAGGTDPETGETTPKGSAGGDGSTQADRDKVAKAAEQAAAKAKAARDKAAQQHLSDLKEWVKQEGGILEGRNALLTQLGERAMSDELARRQQHTQKLFADADAKVAKLTGDELDYTERVKAIVEERDLALRELRAKFDADDEKTRQEQLEAELAQAEADKEVALAELELKLANGVINEWAYQDAIHAVKKAAYDRDLELLKQKNGSESAEYKRLTSEKLKDEADYVAKKKNIDNDVARFEKGLAAVKKVLGSEELAFLGETLGKKSLLYKAALAVQKAVALAEIGIGLQKQIAANSEAGAKISASAPPVTVPLGVAYTIGTNALALVGAAAASTKVLGFRTGGATSAAGRGSEVGLQVAAGGKLVDSDGFAVAGVVHENEYVIPAWLREDPKVVQMEQYLEARRLRGYQQGGPTSGAAPMPTADAELSDSEVVALLRQLVAGQQRIDEWARELRVVQNLYEFDQEYDTYKKVNQQSGLRG